MKIKKVNIRNFKTIKNIIVNFSPDMTLIVGKNNIGKSNALKALDLFFKNISSKEVIVSPEDFRKNAVSIKIDVYFSNIKSQIKRLSDRLKDESKKKRSNQQVIRDIENYYYILNLYANRNDEIIIRNEISRNNEKKITVLNQISKKKEDDFNTYLLKKYISLNLVDKEYLKEFQINNYQNWFQYKWIKIINIEGDEVKYSINEEIKTFNKPHDLTLNQKETEEKLIKLINSLQRFLYIPAYRGGKNERTDAIEKLFDIIIDDLVSSKGANKDYDTITDAIWGTGRNTNPYNIHKVVDARIQSLINSIKQEAISSIKGINFKPYSKSEIRRQILKIMLGSTNVILDDGIPTSYESKGTGIQSSFMISLLKSLSQIENTSSLNIILVIEEPEAFTHPQLTREIIDKMIENKANSFQFIITTHSPVIVDYINAAKIQRFAEENRTTIKETINQTVNPTLTSEEWNLINRIIDINLSEIIFSDFVVFVEGEGDKYVICKLLKIILKNDYHKISVVSINGNGQIFKLFEMLKYFKIQWVLLTDKDSFVDRKNEEEEITISNLSTFFEKFQIGEDFQDNYRKVLDNPNIEKFVITRSSQTVKYGKLLKKLKNINPNITEDDKQLLFGIVTEKIDNEFIPDVEAIEISNKLNKKLQSFNVPFYSLPGDLESFVVNKSTSVFAENVFKKYYPEAFAAYQERTKNFDEQSKLNDLRKSLGSKRFEIKKIPSNAKERKKPHIPLEIISDYLDDLQNKHNQNSDKILTDFKELSLLKDIIEENIK